jgi:hypothetical protein
MLRKQVLRVSCSTGEKFIQFADPQLVIETLKVQIQTEYKKHAASSHSEIIITKITDKDDFILHDDLCAVTSVQDIFKNGDIVKVQVSHLKPIMQPAESLRSQLANSFKTIRKTTSQEEHKRKREDENPSDTEPIGDKMMIIQDVNDTNTVKKKKPDDEILDENVLYSDMVTFFYKHTIPGAIPPKFHSDDLKNEFLQRINLLSPLYKTKIVDLLKK